MTALLISGLRFGVHFWFDHITVAPFGSRTGEGFVFKPTRRVLPQYSSAGALVRILRELYHRVHTAQWLAVRARSIEILLLFYYFTNS